MSETAPHAAVRLLSSLSKHLVVLVPLSMALGFGMGLMVDLAPLKPAILPLTVLMVYPMLVNFRLGEAVGLKDAKAVGLATALNFAVLPLVAWGVASLFFGDSPGLFVGTLLIGIFPTSGMTISWTGFAKGNVGAAVKMTVLGLLLAALLAPFYLSVMAGKVVSVDVPGVARTVGLVVAVPMLAGTLTRWLLVRKLGGERYRTRVAPVFPGISMIGVMAIVFLAIGLKAEMIVNDPALVARITLPLVLLYGTLFAGVTLLARLTLSRGDGIAVVYGTVMRNLSIALGIAIASFGPEAALVLAAAYVVQVQGAAWYVRIADRALGAAEEATPVLGVA